MLYFLKKEGKLIKNRYAEKPLLIGSVLTLCSAGIPVSIALSYLMFTAMKDKLYAFELNWPMYGAVILAVFVIVGISMALGGRKLTDESIIDTLKTDAV